MIRLLGNFDARSNPMVGIGILGRMGLSWLQIFVDGLMIKCFCRLEFNSIWGNGRNQKAEDRDSSSSSSSQGTFKRSPKTGSNLTARQRERERRDGREGDRAPPGRSRRKRKKRERPRTAATTIAATGDPRTAAATRRRRTYGKLSVSPLCGSSSCNLFPVMADSDLSCATGDSLGSEGCRLSAGISVFYLAGIAFCRQIIPIFDSHEID
ncbi:hypothetical protein LXL04_010010 [Taraxacum kok-saghyz]